jgi:hypothetical protein
MNDVVELQREFARHHHRLSLNIAIKAEGLFGYIDVNDVGHITCLQLEVNTINVLCWHDFSTVS